MNNPYELVYLPNVYDEIKQIRHYISIELASPIAADKLMQRLSHAFESIRALPYASPIFAPDFGSIITYRKKVVKSYLIVYAVDEDAQTITIVRVIHSRQNTAEHVEKNF